MISTFFKLDQLKNAYKQLTVIFMRVVTPAKSVDYFQRYFATCTKLTVEKETNAVFQFNLYLFLLGYWTLVQLVFILFPLSPVVRLLLFDSVFIQQLNNVQFYLLYIGIISYTANIHWEVYRRCLLFTQTERPDRKGSNGHYWRTDTVPKESGNNF